MRIRELRVGEVSLLRELRLRALQDAPSEFGDTFEAAREQPDDYWRAATRSLTGDAGQRMFIAESDERQLGSVFALEDAQDPEGGRLGGMWVDSTERRLGIGMTLVQAVIEWAVRRRLRCVRLWVGDGDTPAHRLYLRAGFRDTDERDTSREKIDKDLVAMILELPPAPGTS